MYHQNINISFCFYVCIFDFLNECSVCLLYRWFNRESFKPQRCSTCHLTSMQTIKGTFWTLDAQNNSFNFHSMNQQHFSCNRSLQFSLPIWLFGFNRTNCGHRDRWCFCQQPDVTGKQQSLVWTPATHWHTDASYNTQSKSFYLTDRNNRRKLHHFDNHRLEGKLNVQDLI